MTKSVFGRFGRKLRVEGPRWIIPGFVIFSLVPVGLIYWLMLAVGIHYHGADLMTWVIAGALYASLGVVFYLMLRLMWRRAWKIWHRCFLAVLALLFIAVSWMGMEGNGWFPMGFFAAGVYILMAILQEQMTPGLEGAHD